MRSLFLFAILLVSAIFAFAQNEQAPILEKELAYRDWTYKNVKTGEEINLRKFAKGKKLVMVVYFAPWCKNWKHDAPMVLRLYEKYHKSGLDIIAIGEYDPIEAMKTNLDALKIPFPAVYESEAREQREKTLHHGYRRETGDTRKWGSPWYLFLGPWNLEKKGDVISKKAFIVNGELIESEAEKFIREKLGLPAQPFDVASQEKEIEACEPEKKTEFVKP